MAYGESNGYVIEIRDGGGLQSLGAFLVVVCLFESFVSHYNTLLF